jgi:hypothetical protein
MKRLRYEYACWYFIIYLGGDQKGKYGTKIGEDGTLLLSSFLKSRC